jgi:non-ribosomal peptide synthetase component E (peptide arylation enzyme)
MNTPQLPRARLELLETLPKTSVNKTDKRALKARARGLGLY